MDCIGTINFESDMDDVGWASLIAARNELSAIESIEITNPFTKQLSKIVAPDELAAFAVGGESIGALRWSKYGSGIDVFGDSQKMHALINELCTELEGWFDPV